MPRPIDVIRLFCSSHPVRQMVDMIIRHCHRPVFLPIFNNFVGVDVKNPENQPNPAAMILAHAAQILLFAPTSWDEDIIYSRQLDDYEHRYPIAHGPGTELTIGDMFSLEDLNRAVYLVYSFQNRRNGRTNLLNDKPTKSRGNTKWAGYHDPAWKPDQDVAEGSDRLIDMITEDQLDVEMARIATQEQEYRLEQDALNAQVIGRPPPADTRPPPLNDIDAIDFHEQILTTMGSTNLAHKLSEMAEATEAEEMPIMTLARRKQIIALLKQKHGMGDPMELAEKINDTLTPVEHMVDGQLLDDYISSVRADEDMIEYAKNHPGQMDELTEQLRKQASLEFFMASLQPTTNHNLDDICEKFGLTKSPDIRLYTNRPEIQSLKPHQVIDAAAINDRRETPERHTFLSNTMGTGKTRTYLLAISMAARRLAEKQLAGQDVEFRPSILITPVNSLGQTYFEAKECFPDLNIVVFYGQRATFIDKGANVLNTSGLLNYMANLDPKDSQTARTIVITSYTTLSSRFQSRHDQLFVFKKDKAPPSIAKARLKEEKLTEARSKATYEEAELGEGDSGEQNEDTTILPNGRQRKVPRYSSDRVSLDDIIFVDNPKVANGNLVTYSLKNDDVSALKFEFLVVDEAHIAKKFDGSYNNVFRHFKWSTLLWVTGTPLSSSLRDLISPLSLMWRATGIQWDPHTDKMGWLPGLYRPDYDPFLEDNDFGEDRITKGILHPSYNEIDPSAVLLKESWRSDKSRLWMLHPDIYRAAGFRHHWGSNLAAWVVRNIFERMHIRRTMRSSVTLPDGTKTYPAIDLKGFNMWLTELRFGRDRAPDVKRRGKAQARDLFVSGGDGGDVLSSSSSGPASSQFIESASAEANINFGVHRAANLGAFDYHNVKILEEKSPMVRGKKDHILSAARELLSNDGPLTDKQVEKLKALQNRTHEPVVGIDHVNRLIHRDINGGLTYLYHIARVDPNTLAPADRASMLYWVCAESPILIYTIDLLNQYVSDQKKRVLLFVDTPWIQCVTVAILTLAGFNVLTIRSCDKAAERNAAIHEWNNPNANCEVFVANVNTMATGVNMHHCCNTGIFMSFHLNMQVNLQCAGRLTRIGQKELVNWHMLKVADSYHDNMERLSVVKWGPQLSAEMRLPVWIEDELREIIIFETIKTYFRTEFNRYSWVVLRDLFGHDFDYHDQRARRLGHLFSIIAKIISHCTEDKDFWIQNTPFLLLACLRLVSGNQDLDDWHTLLQHDAETLARQFIPPLRDAFTAIKVKLEKDPEMKVEQKKLRRMVEHRKKQAPSDLIEANGDGSDNEHTDTEDNEDPADTYDAPEDNEPVKPDTSRRALSKGKGKAPVRAPAKSQAKKRSRAPATEEAGESSKRVRHD
ncbi:hypothetical protein N0V84_012674 [Fusarium piperis]|uniref:Helicase ATP-binding domain-containing protein n=1 Tax=Fusarium piperis TaxID=1435070 RepID=A0A9W8TB65_9HYPO|nr:hypothetical protein N0V84_012674 [Fusarium piperis]